MQEIQYRDRLGNVATAREFFEAPTMTERFDKMRTRLAQQEQEHDIISVKRVKVGRNQPCPCGSGVKFKKCCIDTAQQEV